MRTLACVAASVLVMLRRSRTSRLAPSLEPLGCSPDNSLRHFRNRVWRLILPLGVAQPPDAREAGCFRCSKKSRRMLGSGFDAHQTPGCLARPLRPARRPRDPPSSPRSASVLVHCRWRRAARADCRDIDAALRSRAACAESRAFEASRSTRSVPEIFTRPSTVERITTRVVARSSRCWAPPIAAFVSPGRSARRRRGQRRCGGGFRGRPHVIAGPSADMVFTASA